MGGPGFLEWMEWGRGLIISGVLRGRSVGKILEMLWSWGVVEASLYGELEGSLSILLGGILERVALRNSETYGRGCGWGLVVAAPP